MSDNSMGLEEVIAFLDNLGDISDAKRRSIAKTLGHTLPPSEISEQLSAVVVKRGHIGKNKVPTDYVTVPNFILESGSARGFWLRTDLARRVAERILAVCDAEGIE